MGSFAKKEDLINAVNLLYDYGVIETEEQYTKMLNNIDENNLED